MKRILFALLFFANFTGFAEAQCNGVFQNNTVCGNITGGPNLPRPTNPSAFLGAAGGTNGQTQYNNSGALGGYTPSGDVTVNPSTGVETISAGAVTSSKLASNALSVVPSRAAATSLDLSAFSAIRTLGYAAAGDGGGAVFKKVGAGVAFRDTYYLTGTITPGSAYTNGTYRGVGMTTLTGTGSGLTCTITVALTVVSSAVCTQSPGNGFNVGDTLTASNVLIGGTGSGFVLTVATVSTATGSFVDNAGTRWQIVVDNGNYYNTRQFGAAVNWIGVDGTATNDFTAIQNALYAAADTTSPTIDAGGTAGTTILSPHGTSYICTAGTTPLTVPYGVRWTGQNSNASNLKVCDSGWDADTPIIDLCDPTTHLSCFGTILENITVEVKAVAGGNANVPVIFSNNIQQLEIIRRVFVYGGLRSCLKYDTGYGGAALIGISQFECTIDPTSTNPGINFTNIGTIIVNMSMINIESGGSGATTNGFQATGGFYGIEGGHCEGISTCFFVNITGSNSNGIFRLHNYSGGVHCTNLMLKQTGSAANTVIVGQLVPNGCTNTTNNGGTTSGAVVAGDTVF